jgi:hypothetical protein
LFQFFSFWPPKSAMDYQTLAFQPASIRIDLVKTIQNQHRHRIGRVVAIVGIRHFLDPELYGHFHLSPHVIPTILIFSHNQILPAIRFSEKLVRKKLNQTDPMRQKMKLCHKLSSLTASKYYGLTVVWYNRTMISLVAERQSMDIQLILHQKLAVKVRLWRAYKCLE